MSKEARSVFGFLRPACSDLCDYRNLLTLRELRSRLEIISNIDIRNGNLHPFDEFLQYVLFPFRLILKDSPHLKDDMIIQSLNCLGYILDRSNIKEWKVFEDLLHVLFSKVDSALKIEDKLLALINCLKSLINKAASQVCLKLYDVNNLPILGKLVHILLLLIQSDNSQDIKLASLNCLKALCTPSYLESIDEEIKEDLKLRIGDILASVLPGITKAISGVIPSNTKLGSKIKCGCLNVLSDIFCSTLGDEYLTKCIDKEATREHNNIDDRLKSVAVVRNKAWVNLTSSKLQQCFALVSSASSSQEWTVRLECLKLFQQLLIKCTHSLKLCTSIFIAVPVKLMNDDYTEIQMLAESILSQRKQFINMEDEEFLNDTMKKNLYSLCSNLPIVLRKSDDEEKFSKLSLILGYVGLLKNEIKEWFKLPVYQKKITTALLDCLELDFSSVNILDNVSASFDVTSSSMKLRFVHFSEDRVLKVVKKLCRCIGQYCDIDFLYNSLIDIFLSSNLHCKQVLLIYNEMLLGAKAQSSNDETVKMIISDFLNLLIQPENWHLITSRESSYNTSNPTSKPKRFMISNSTSNSNNQLNHNILLACLQIETIYVFSEVLKCDFKSLLVTALYPLLEKRCDENPVVSTRAEIALSGIANNCEYSNTSEMISANADHIISMISIQLMNLTVFPKCPSVLKALLDLCDETILPLVRDTIDEVLISLDTNHFNNKQLLLFLPVMSSIIKALEKFVLGNQEHINSNPERSHGDDDDAIDLQKYFEDYHKQTNISLLEEEPEIAETSEEIHKEDEAISDVQEIVPDEVKIADQVLSRSKNLMANKSPKVRLLVLDTIYNGLLVLSSHENSLLPMAHKLWPSLICRFKDQETQVVLKAFEVVCRLTNLCKQFMRKRICSDVLYNMLEYLKHQAKENVKGSVKQKKQIQQIAFKHTQLFKLQKFALLSLGPLLEAADVSSKDVYHVCISCYRYLSIQQNRQLQSSAITLFHSLIKLDKDAIWLFLTDIISPEVLSKPIVPDELDNFKFHDVILQGSADKNNLYYKNMSALIKLC